MTETEISRLTISLLEISDRAERQHTAMLAIAAWMETYPPEQRHTELTPRSAISPIPSGRQISMRSVLRQRTSPSVAIKRNAHHTHPIPVPPVGCRPDLPYLLRRHTPHSPARLHPLAIVHNEQTDSCIRVIAFLRPTRDRVPAHVGTTPEHRSVSPA
jgi:hypothetical protein